jgi:hypothetical protein
MLFVYNVCDGSVGHISYWSWMFISLNVFYWSVHRLVVCLFPDKYIYSIALSAYKYDSCKCYNEFIEEIASMNVHVGVLVL